MKKNQGLEAYEIYDKLGEGSYGCVYLGVEKGTGVRVAIKKIRFYPEDEGIPCTALREIGTLRDCNHPGIITLMDVTYLFEQQKLYMVFEYFPSDLRRFIDSFKGSISANTALFIINQLLAATCYLHHRKIVHRDIKPSNILIEISSSKIKLADFGMAKTIGFLETLKPTVLTREVQTLWYRAPEVLMGQENYSFMVDIWSIGCVLWEMLEGTPPFTAVSEIEQLFKMFQFFGTPNEASWPGFTKLKFHSCHFPNFEPRFKSLSADFPGGPLIQDLLGCLLVLDPAKRLSAWQALKHPAFDELDVPRVPGGGFKLN